MSTRYSVFAVYPSRIRTKWDKRLVMKPGEMKQAVTCLPGVMTSNLGPLDQQTHIK